jgi:sugar phosphate isomerase/epimerase
MFMNLSTGAIGIRGMTLDEMLALARETGFEGIDFDIREVAALVDDEGFEAVRARFERAGIVPGQWGLPVAWQDDDRWRQDLDALPRLAALGRDLGCTRTATWCPPASDTHPFDENFAWHVDRFGPIAETLAAQGCKLGIEFIGPKTLRTGRRYPFIHTLEGMMRLADAIGTGNVGLLLDAWHLYTSGGTLEDLDAITADDVVTVHVNDAPEGVPLEAQIDNVRCLPMETGVIDLPGFMRKLASMDYEGPVTAEPFSARLNEIAADDPERAARLTKSKMDALWEAADLRA